MSLDAFPSSDRDPRVFWGREHIDFAPLRTVFPDHDDLGWMWMEAMISPDTDVIVHAYKLSGIGYLWLDHVGRPYRFEHPAGPRLLEGDRRIVLLDELCRLFDWDPDALPRIVRLVPPGTDSESLQVPVEVRWFDDDCDGCRKERATQSPEATLADDARSAE